LGENGRERDRTGDTVRDRGPRTRRSASGRIDPPHSTPPSRSSLNVWQAIAIIALIAATAGWTTAIVLATRQSSVAQASASAPDDGAIPSDEETAPPVANTHDAPELEALLPTTMQDTPLQVESWTGTAILNDDAYSDSLRSFLNGQGKTADDLLEAQAYDPTASLDFSVAVYRLTGVAPDKLRDALIAAWKVDPDVANVPVSTVTIDGKPVTKLDFPEDTADSYLYVRDDVVFDIESSDEAIVTKAIQGLPKAGSTPRPSGSAPAATATPPRSAPAASPS
jgi:hypothetical protein